jgi:hypothetical protein
MRSRLPCSHPLELGPKSRRYDPYSASVDRRKLLAPNSDARSGGRVDAGCKMVVSPTAPETTRRRRSRQAPAEPVWTDTLEALETLYVARPPSQPLEPETISSQWRVALDAAESALSAAAGAVPASELARRRTQLVQERLETAKALTRLARVTSVLGEDHESVALRGRRSSSLGAGWGQRVQM